MKPALKLKVFLTLIPFSLLSLTISPTAPMNAVLAAQTQTGTSEQPALDRLVDVGGYRLYIKCIGSGSPTVILEAGLGGGSDDWAKVMPDVGKFARVCSYDRPSEGKSDRAPRTLRRFGSHTYIELRTGQQIVQDLHTLLAKAGETGPYVLVGHSLGGLYAILYANQYPRDIVGMVLVDASHPDQSARAAALTGPEKAKRSHDGLMQNEEGADIDGIFAQVRAEHWRSNIPLYVLAQGLVRPPPAGWSSDQWTKYMQAKREMQADHAGRSPNSKLIIAEKSGHDIPEDQPELVVDAIKQVVNLARNKQIRRTAHRQE
jgi:pimeloyl-ACP methyl ester carboxylesterase